MFACPSIILTMSQILTEIWSGDTRYEDEALQLLYIIDIVAIWAEHNYKPFIGCCISRLRAKWKGESFPPDNSTLLSAQIEISRINFPWLFDPNPEQPTSSEHVNESLHVPNNEHSTSQSQRSGSSRPSSPSENNSSYQSRQQPSRNP